jgi:tryptophan-rich sensory protein
MSALQEGTMIRERALKVVLVLVGLIFTAAVYPLMMFFSREPALAMMLSLYVTLGILLLMSVRDPAAHRSLISFAAWSSFAHATVMAIMAVHNTNARDYLMGVAIFVVIGIPLLALAPRKQSSEQASAACA